MSQLHDGLVNPRRITVAEWHVMVAAEVFGPDDHIELIDGVIAQMARQGPHHGHIVAILAESLTRAVPPDLMVRSHVPLTFEGSEPEPDVAVVERSALRQIGSHPTSARLVVEVAQSSLRTDRLVKGPIYARAG